VFHVPGPAEGPEEEALKKLHPNIIVIRVGKFFYLIKIPFPK
jgi:hypothetical protein